MKTYSFKNIPFFPLLVVFFIFASLFPTLRVLSIGTETSTSVSEYLFSIVPEIFALLIIILSFLIWKKKKTEIKILDWLLLAFVLSNTIIGSLISQDLMLSAYGIRLTYFPILFYFVFRFLDAKSLLGSVQLIFIWFVVLALIGIVLYFAFYDSMIAMMQITNPVLPEYFVVRMSSVFWTPVVFSTFMMVSIFYFFYRFMVSQNWIWLAIIAVVSFCTIMSMSRGAMVSTVVGLLLLTILYHKIRVVYPWITIAAAFFFTTIIIASPEEVLSWIFQSTAETVGMKEGVTRVDLWMNAIDNFREHPFGMGLGKAGHVAARFFDSNTSGADVFSTDGWFLKTLNETGVWGLFSYLLFAGTFLVIVVRQLFRHPQRPVLVFMLTLFLTVNLQNMVSNVLDFYLFSFVYWGIIGLAANLIYNRSTIA